MRCYTELEEIKHEYLQLLREVTTGVALLPEKDSRGAWVRCHELAIAVNRVYPLGTVEHGYYEDSIEHSWIRLNHNTLLDVYVPAAVPQVQLIHLPRFVSRMRDRYQEEPRADFLMVDEPCVGWLVDLLSKTVSSAV